MTRMCHEGWRELPSSVQLLSLNLNQFKSFRNIFRHSSDYSLVWQQCNLILDGLNFFIHILAVWRLTTAATVAWNAEERGEAMSQARLLPPPVLLYIVIDTRFWVNHSYKHTFSRIIFHVLHFLYRAWIFATHNILLEAPWRRILFPPWFPVFWHD